MTKEEAEALMKYTDCRITQAFASMSGDAQILMEVDAALKKAYLDLVALVKPERMPCPKAVACGREGAVTTDLHVRCCPSCGLLVRN